LKIAVGTLFLNYSVLFAKSSGFEENAISLLDIVTKSIQNEIDAEVLYRALVTVGNLLTMGKLLLQAAKEIYGVKSLVARAVSKVDAQKEKRIIDLGAEIEMLLSGK